MTINKPLDLQVLRALAEKASPGPWWIGSHGHSMSDRDHKTVFQAVDLIKPAVRHPETGNLSHWPNDWDASFIAAANPETVLSLLDTIETLQSECERLRNLLGQCRPVMHAQSGASHLAEGFRPKRNRWDELVERIDAAMRGEKQ